MTTGLGRWTGLVAAAVLVALPALAADQVTFGTNWKAQAEHGGYYQAVVDGTYASHGLEVTIRQGGPNIHHPQLLAAGDRQSVVGGKRVSVRVNLGGGRIIKKKKK